MVLQYPNEVCDAHYILGSCAAVVERFKVRLVSKRLSAGSVTSLDWEPRNGEFLDGVRHGRLGIRWVHL